MTPPADRVTTEYFPPYLPQLPSATAVHVLIPSSTLLGDRRHHIGMATPQDLVTFPSGRWFGPTAFQHVVDRTSSPTVNLATIYRLYGEQSIRIRFYDRLSPIQENMYYFISSYDQWSQASHRFIEEVTTYKMIAIDIERLLTNAVDAMPVVYVTCATPSGLTAVFSLLQLAGRHGVDPAAPFEFLPTVVRNWIANPDIAVLGSAVRAQLRGTAVPYSSTVDTRDIFTTFSNRRIDDRCLIDITNLGFRTGTGVQALFGKGEDFRPQEQRVYLQRYGEHAYQHRGRSCWPWWRRTSRLFQWHPNNAGHLDSRHRWFLWHTATTPYSLCYRLLLERSVVTPDFLTAFGDPAEALQTLIREFVHPSLVHPRQHLEDRDGHGRGRKRRRDQQITPSEIQPRRRDARASSRSSLPLLPGRVADHRSSSSSDSGASAHSSSSHATKRGSSSSSSHSERSRSSSTPPVSPNALLGDEADDHDIPPAIRERRRQVMVSPIVHDWSLADEAMFPYLRSPPLTRGCTCCGDPNHVFKCMGDIICSVYNANHRRYLCSYKGCRSPSFHLTTFCPWLHRICPNCCTRGHTPHTDNCSEWDADMWDKRRDEWEDVADLGVHTRRREADWRLGFYAHRRHSPFPFPYGSYDEMIRLPVLTVLSDLRRFSDEGVWPFQTRVPKPTGFPFPEATLVPRSTGRETTPSASRNAGRNRPALLRRSLSSGPTRKELTVASSPTRGDPATSSPNCSTAPAPAPSFEQDDTLQIHLDPSDRM